MSHGPALSRELATWATGVTAASLPPAVADAMKVYILDDMAGALVGSITPWGDMVVHLAAESAGGGACTLIGRTERSSPSYAALVNGTFVGGFETDHVYTQASSHPSAGVFPAALAAAESRHATGAAFLAALAAGYETCIRVGVAATRAVEDQRGFHGPGTNSSFGAAVASAKIMGLDAAAVLNALGIAGSHAGGLLEFHHEGAMTKRIHPGRGSQMGYECAVLASQGFTGPSTVLEGDTGFLHVYSPTPNPPALTERLGEHWYLLGMTVKSFPCHITSQSVVEGVWRYRQRTLIDAATVTRVELHVGGRQVEERYLDKAPTTVLGAQYSLPFSTAIALCVDAGDPRSYSQPVVNNPLVRAVAQMVEIVPTPGFGAPGQPTAEVVVTAGGLEHRFACGDWKGAPSNQYTYPEMAGKFRRYAGHLLSSDAKEGIIERVGHLETEPDMAAVAQLLAKR